MAFNVERLLDNQVNLAVATGIYATAQKYKHMTAQQREVRKKQTPPHPRGRHVLRVIS